MTSPMTEQTRAFIRKRVAAGVTAAQIKIELKTRGVRVAFAEVLAFDPERKGALDLAWHQRREMREMLQNSMRSNSSANATIAANKHWRATEGNDERVSVSG